MSRSPVLRSLLIALFCFCVFSARPAHAGFHVNSITAVPNPAPAVGGAVPIYVDCTNASGVTAAPSGSAMLTDSQGTVLSQNTFVYSSRDGYGNPIVYTLLIVPQNYSATSSASYSVHVSVSDSLGDTASGSTTLQQSCETPITIDGVSVTPDPLPSSGGSITVQAGLSCDGPGQAGFFKGTVYLQKADGWTLDEEPLFGPQGTDGNANPIYFANLSNVPANTSSSPVTYTVTVVAEDNLGGESQASASLMVLSPKQPTAVGVMNKSGQTGQKVVLNASLRQSSNNAAIPVHTLAFWVDGQLVGTALTSSNGTATCTYAVPAGASTGSHRVSTTFGGSNAYGPSAASGTLTVAKASGS